MSFKFTVLKMFHWDFHLCNECHMTSEGFILQGEQSYSTVRIHFSPWIWILSFPGSPFFCLQSPTTCTSFLIYKVEALLALRFYWYIADIIINMVIVVVFFSHFCLLYLSDSMFLCLSLSLNSGEHNKLAEKTKLQSNHLGLWCVESEHI